MGPTQQEEMLAASVEVAHSGQELVLFFPCAFNIQPGLQSEFYLG